MYKYNSFNQHRMVTEKVYILLPIMVWIKLGLKRKDS